MGLMQQQQVSGLRSTRAEIYMFAESIGKRPIQFRRLYLHPMTSLDTDYVLYDLDIIIISPLKPSISDAFHLPARITSSLTTTLNRPVGFPRWPYETSTTTPILHYNPATADIVPYTG